jgi:hypothetical protein
VKTKLDPKTLRWASRKAAAYERELRGFMAGAPSLRMRAMYERAAVTAFVLRVTYRSKARAIETAAKKRKAKR